MGKIARKLIKIPMFSITVAALTLIVVVGTLSIARADETDAKDLLKTMSDYMVSQTAISFGFDATLEVITEDDQKLALASSGTITMDRPGKIRARRSGGHADIEMVFDGETLTLFGSNLNLYSQIEIPGTVDNLVDVLRKDYDRPLPAADLLLSNVYDELMDGVIDIKDLGSGVIEGIECDYFAFRNEEVDWQIWIAHGPNPYPVRYVITSKDMPHSPQYTIQIRDWKTGSDVESDNFAFENPTNATKVDVEDLKGMSPLPDHFKRGDSK
jgi:hypothetical protein